MPLSKILQVKIKISDLSVVGVIPTKDAGTRKPGNLSVPTVRGIKGVLNTKNRHLGPGGHLNVT